MISSSMYWFALPIAFAGVSMLGELERSGAGVPVCVDQVKSIDALRENCASNNTALLTELRESSNASELLEMTRKDAAMGRMSDPVPVNSADLHGVLLNPRFAVEQEKEDGSVKLRAIDHLSWSPSTLTGEGGHTRPTKKARKEASVNGHTAPQEKMSHDTLDALARAMRLHEEKLGSVPGLLKVRYSVLLASMH